MEIIKLIAALATVATGFYALVAPLKVRGFTGLDLPGGRGITELRSVLGGFFLFPWALLRSSLVQRICS